FLLTMYSLYLAFSLLHFFCFTYTFRPLFYTLSLHDALPIYIDDRVFMPKRKLIPLPSAAFQILLALAGEDLHGKSSPARASRIRSEEHTSELQSRGHLVCRLLLEKKKKKTQ